MMPAIYICRIYVESRSFHADVAMSYLQGIALSDLPLY